MRFSSAIEMINEYNQGRFTEVTKEQRNELYGRFNKYFHFEYFLNDDYEFCLFMSSDGFKSFEYYTGLEYDREEILCKVDDGDNILISYNVCERIENIMEILEIEN